MQQDKMQRLIDDYIAAYNRFDVPAMLAQLDPQVVFENYSNGECSLAARGLKDFQALAEQAKALLSERRQTVTAAQYGDESATLSIQYQARLARDLPSGGKAGEEMKLDAATVFRFADGKISYIADYS